MGDAVDFVVLGFGLGALVVLLGLALRNLGPWARRIRQGQVLPWSEVSRRVTWGRACRAAGLVVAIAGGFVFSMTLVALVGRVSDATGALVVLFASAAALLACVGWALVYARRQARLAPVLPGMSASPRSVPTMNVSLSPAPRRRCTRGADDEAGFLATESLSASNGVTPEGATLPQPGTSGVPAGSADEDPDLGVETAGSEPAAGDGDAGRVTTVASPVQAEANPPAGEGSAATNGAAPSGASSKVPRQHGSAQAARPLADGQARSGIRAGLGAVSPSNRTR